MTRNSFSAVAYSSLTIQNIRLLPRLRHSSATPRVYIASGNKTCPPRSLLPVRRPAHQTLWRAELSNTSSCAGCGSHAITGCSYIAHGFSSAGILTLCFWVTCALEGVVHCRVVGICNVAGVAAQARLCGVVHKVNFNRPLARLVLGVLHAK